MSTIWTIKALLDWTTNYLAQKGFESARLEAQLLLAHVLRCPKIDLLVRFDEVPSEQDRSSYRELIRRRLEHWPVAYLTGTKEFFGLELEVSPAVLIPRPDTETLVLEALRRLKPMGRPRILDLGTGSGCIAIALAKHHPHLTAIATDLSPDAITLAQRNAARHHVARRIQYRTGDLFDPIPAGEAFDLIVSNPPYVTTSELATLEPTVRDHEPRLALDGGPDGLAFYRRIVTQAPAYLVPGGYLLVEIAPHQADKVQQLFTQGGYQALSTYKDLSGHSRVIAASKPTTAP